MKASEIEVGQVLAMSRDRDLYQYTFGVRKVTVIETGVPIRVRSGTKGTKVREEKNGQEYVVPNGRLRMPWAEYAAERERLDKAKAEREDKTAADRFARARAALKMEADFRAAGIEPSHDYAYGYRANVLREAGWEVDEVGRVETVFPNLADYVYDGKALMVKAQAVAAVLHEIAAV